MINSLCSLLVQYLPTATKYGYFIPLSGFIGITLQQNSFLTQTNFSSINVSDTVGVHLQVSYMSGGPLGGQLCVRGYMLLMQRHLCG